MSYDEFDKVVNRILIFFIIIFSFLFGISMNVIENVSSDELKIVDDESIPVEIQELINFIESKNKDNDVNDLDILENKN